MANSFFRNAGLAALVSGCVLVSAAQADDRDTVLESCAVNLKLTEAGCICVADKSEAELNDKQYMFFIASITGDREVLSKPSTMTQDEAMGVMDFMTKTPGECQAG